MSKLFIVSTPIGNLADITLRSIEVLKSADLILAEDTRTSLKLLKHYNIKTAVESFHMHNEHKKLEYIINKLKNNVEIALISDAGTPGISDPGFLLVRECVKHEVDIECLPGPTAFVPALVCSGLPTDRFSFEGFLPVKKGRTKRLKQIAEEKKTMVFYESPHRLLKTLNDFSNYFNDESSISVSRELTKLFEETFRGTIKESIKYFEKNKPKGEFVIVLSPN
ncbi:MAG: 16S rRNA (cytidine(1402)-2'-O)-methyltransferase [Bacteroidetes bacterium]|jgi:16S rRNA (cytidine1402-2'-O)-methyltransferase|nr:16S rRNA (cytidine(1402)-2'-O)-methyltransferase [Flavobacteriaceae bacterium]NCF42369.1 16S rRNA (cytidine(1402)-2'-O)-methyltransferase [Bacteroidota bacterium]